MLPANNGPRIIHETQLSALPHWVCVTHIQYIPRNMHTVFALLCFIVVIHWLIFPYPPGLLHWHCGNLTIAPVPAKQPWWIWINTSWEFIMNDCITTTKQSTTKPCAYFLGYTVPRPPFGLYGDLEPACPHAITWTIVDLSLIRGLEISFKIWNISLRKMHSKMRSSKRLKCWHKSHELYTYFALCSVLLWFDTKKSFSGL